MDINAIIKFFSSMGKEKLDSAVIYLHKGKKERCLVMSRHDRSWREDEFIQDEFIQKLEEISNFLEEGWGMKEVKTFYRVGMYYPSPGPISSVKVFKEEIFLAPGEEFPPQGGFLTEEEALASPSYKEGRTSARRATNALLRGY